MFPEEVIIRSSEPHLRHDAHSFPQTLQTNVTDVLARDEDVALLGLVETIEQPDDRALPRRKRKSNSVFCGCIGISTKCQGEERKMLDIKINITWAVSSDRLVILLLSFGSGNFNTLYTVQYLTFLYLMACMYIYWEIHYFVEPPSKQQFSLEIQSQISGGKWVQKDGSIIIWLFWHFHTETVRSTSKICWLYPSLIYIRDIWYFVFHHYACLIF